MGRASLDERIRAVLLYIDGTKEANEIHAAVGVSLRTLRRWIRAYRTDAHFVVGKNKALAFDIPTLVIIDLCRIV